MHCPIFVDCTGHQQHAGTGKYSGVPIMVKANRSEGEFRLLSEWDQSQDEKSQF